MAVTQENCITKTDQIVAINDKVKLAVRIYTPDHWTSEYKKPDIILLHEALGCIGMWRDFGTRLAQATGLRVVAYDREGYGNSTALRYTRNPDYLHIYAEEELPALLKELNIETPILFGHSDGGTIALLYAAKFKPAAIITEAGHVFVEDVTLNGIDEALEVWATTNLEERLAKYHGDKTKQIFDAWAVTWRTPPFPDWNIEDDLKTITCPTLIIQGAEDEYGTEKQVESILTHVSGPVKASMIPDCKHIPHLQAQDVVLDITSNFINEQLA